MQKIHYAGMQLLNATPMMFIFALLYEAVRTWKVNALLFASCLLLNGAVNLGLKAAFKKPRPCKYTGCSATTKKDKNDECGMPSGHAQFFGFFLTFLTASIVAQKHYSASACYLLTLSYLIAIAMLVTRVTSGCHTVQQVLVGLVLGIAFGFIVFVSVYYGKKSLLYPSGPYK